MSFLQPFAKKYRLSGVDKINLSEIKPLRSDNSGVFVEKGLILCDQK